MAARSCSKRFTRHNAAPIGYYRPLLRPLAVLRGQKIRASLEWQTEPCYKRVPEGENPKE